MDDIYEISLLLDFYGQLLTERQYELMDLYYNNDYSLAEISEQLVISRQGVHDGIKKAKAILTKMESRLNLISRFNQQKNKAKEALTIINEIEEDLLNNNFDTLLKIKISNIKACIEEIDTLKND